MHNKNLDSMESELGLKQIEEKVCVFGILKLVICKQCWINRLQISILILLMVNLENLILNAS